MERSFADLGLALVEAYFCFALSVTANLELRSRLQGILSGSAFDLD